MRSSRSEKSDDGVPSRRRSGIGRWWIVVALMVSGALAGFVFASVQPESYSSSSKVYLRVQQVESTSELSQVSTYRTEQASLYADVASSTTIQDRVAETVGGGASGMELAGMVTAEPDSDRPTMTITAESESGDLSQRVVSESVSELSDYVAENEPVVDGSPVLSLDVVEVASPGVQTRTSPVMVGVFGAVIGAFIGIAILLGAGAARR